MLSLTELAVLGFAAARGTQLLRWDSILDPVRDRLEAWHLDRHDKYWPTFLRTLANCHYCVGWHLSWVTLLVYLTATGQLGTINLLTFGIDTFAVAGVQMIVQRLDNGWAE